jgi:hypothetical protein
LRLRSRICLIRSAGAGIEAPLVVVGNVTRYGSESKRMRKVTRRQPFVFCCGAIAFYRCIKNEAYGREAPRSLGAIRRAYEANA